MSCGVSCLTYCSAYIICCSLSFDSVLVALCTVKHGIPAKNLIEINTVVQYEAKKRSVLVSKVKYNVKPYNEKTEKNRLLNSSRSFENVKPAALFSNA